MKPSIGRIVHYRLTEQDATAINRRRVAGAGHQEDWPMGAQAHSGNGVRVGEVVPMIICIVWPNEHGPTHDVVNGQCFLDGNDSLWVTSVKEGTAAGQWSWPPRVE
jgi:hypothetical protein